MENTKGLLIVLSIILFVVLVGFTLFNTQHYILLSLLIMSASFMPFMIRFTHQKLTSRELVMLAVLGAIAAVSRVPFASLPSIQPTTFVIIVAAIALGPQSGFVIGVLAAIVSNLFLGQGPWTPWQMYSWGMIGLIAGLLQKRWVMTNMIGRCMYGLIVGFLFGWVMNLWFILGVIQEVNWIAILLYYSASFGFDLAHALSNVFFLLLFSASWIKILERFKRKYGLFK
ncbi:ECF transporter S component [Virgibacillus sp. C22-A2]|uniref:ECF transporter S component n=1 Tax=Virgibacillus tibetensis TaxID=3042313 RepID=A0ABU6KF79_9BACI|nr:ECF transporter S component [Virgibacillus sp. C22-A2]